MGSSGSSSRSRGFAWRRGVPGIFDSRASGPTLAQERMRRSLSGSILGAQCEGGRFWQFRGLRLPRVDGDARLASAQAQQGSAASFSTLASFKSPLKAEHSGPLLTCRRPGCMPDPLQSPAERRKGHESSRHWLSLFVVERRFWVPRLRSRSCHGPCIQDRAPSCGHWDCFDFAGPGL